MRIKWDFEKLQKEALKYETRREFKFKDYRAYGAAVNWNILNLICSHMPSASNREHTDEEIRTEALKYTSRTQFARRGKGFYLSARRKGKEFLSKICSHMPKRVDTKGKNSCRFKWTNEALILEAKKYSTITSFRTSNPSAYSLSYSRGILKLVCCHMKPSRGASIAEKELFDKIKDVYPDTKTLRDTKAFFLDKPHIHGFDLDIFIPNLMKAIEFDGTYWHSEIGLKQSRKHWPDEDIKNYHQLKDDHFLSKNIKILHIKEEDWIKDKELCVRKCLSFLCSEA